MPMGKNYAKSEFGEFTSKEKYIQMLLIKRNRQSKKSDKAGFYLCS
jgi:hypothetical protein